MLAASTRVFRRVRLVLFAPALAWILFWDGCAHVANGIGTATGGAGHTLPETFDHAMTVAAIVTVIWAALITLLDVLTEKEKRRRGVIIAPTVLIIPGAVLYLSLWLIKRFSQVQ